MAITLPIGQRLISGPAGLLEVLAEPPRSSGRRPNTVGVICHPLPTAGGTMHNKVVTTAARSFCGCGMTAVRFQFRGVGASGGQFDHGHGEQADLAATITWVRQHLPNAVIWLAGFSFGAYVALRAAQAVGAEAMIAIAPPVGRWDFSAIVPPLRWMVVQGEEDELVDAQRVCDWATAQPHPPVLHRMAATSHYFHGRLCDLQAILHDQMCRWGA